MHTHTIKKGLSESVAALAGGLALVFVSVSDARANQAPEPGSEQENLLAPFAEFVQRTPCCTSRDARMHFDEQYTNDPAHPIRIKVTHTVDGLQLSEPVWVDVPAEKIKTAEDILALCKPMVDAAEAQGKISTCVAPPDNVTFAFDNAKRTAEKDASGNVVLTNEYVVTLADKTTYTLKKGDIMPAKDWRYINFVCYWPKPAL